VAEARAFVAGLAEERTVVCERTRGRRVAWCQPDGRDLGAEVIAAELARHCPALSILAALPISVEKWRARKDSNLQPSDP
jgi:hypothetical protein